jgi:hypothetical protein
VAGAATVVEAPADRVLCPGYQCGEDITDYTEDDHVFLKGDDRPYCGMECVIATWRQMQEDRL